MNKDRIPFRHIFLLFLLLPFQGSAVNRPPSFESDSNFSKLDKTMKRMMRKHHLPAFALSLVEGDKVLFESAKGYTDLEQQIPATRSTIFKIYSVSKTFTALEIFREVEEALIDLDAPITDYLPHFSIRSRFPEIANITVRNILAHRSGLPRNACLTCPPNEDDPYSLNKFDWCSADCFLAYPVGTRYKYSNLGYNLLGRIIEEKRDMAYEDYMKKHILTDLGMLSSVFQSKDLEPGEIVANGYEYYKRKYYPMPQSDVHSVPSGNLYSNLEDMTVFLQAVLTNSIFKEENTFRQMCVDHYSKELDPETMGLGWKTTRIAGGELMIWHDGGPDEGVGALVAAVPSQNLAIAMIANSTSFAGNISAVFAKEVLEGIIEKRTKKEEVPIQKVEAHNLSAKHLQSCEGLYIAFGMPMKVKAKNKKLKAKIGGMNLSLIPVSNREYKVTHWMDKMGLTKLVPPPVDFEKLRILFPSITTKKPMYSIINLDNISYEICPRYPDLDKLTEKWDHLLGTYELAWRLPHNQTGPLSGSTYTISKEKGVLRMSGLFGPIIPIEDRHIQFTSMPFAGEIMEYFPESGHLIHQNAVFIPMKD